MNELPTLICVDDEPLVLDGLREQLQRGLGREHVIESAGDGIEALALLDELIAEGVSVPVMIADRNMAGMDGVELLRRVHERDPAILTIMLTGQTGAEAVGLALNQARLYRYLSKPWQEDDLLMTVQEALRRHAQEKALAEREAALVSAKERLEHSLELLHATLDATADAILVLDGTGRTTRCNARFEALWALPADGDAANDDGMTIERLQAKLVNPHALMSGSDDDTPLDTVLECRDGRLIECHYRPHRLHGARIGSVYSFRDVTERERHAAQVHHLAYHDSLTGLPNRLQFNDALERALGEADRHGTPAAVMFVDLDHFKRVNDSLGHAVGDELLRVVVERMRRCARADDVLARWGGDEFTLLLSGFESSAHVTAVARRMLASVARPIRIGEHSLHVSLSIGIALYPEDGETAESLLRHADAALYRVKADGRKGYRFHAATTEGSSFEKLTLAGDLHRALSHDELRLVYQPQVDAESGAITHVEALLRWEHPRWGLLAPDRFVPLAEENDLIVPIGEWVLRTACRQGAAWQAGGATGLGMAVNLSARQIESDDLTATVDRALEESGLAAEYLELEVAETAAMRDSALTIGRLLELRERGARIALDDFGTGFASLSYLMQLPCQTLKIDRSFCTGLRAGTKNAAIIKAVVALGEGLAMRIVVEGVETREAETLLRSLGCRHMQGFRFGRPVTADELTARLQRRPGPHPLRRTG